MAGVLPVQLGNYKLGPQTLKGPHKSQVNDAAISLWSSDLPNADYGYKPIILS